MNKFSNFEKVAVLHLSAAYNLARRMTRKDTALRMLCRKPTCALKFFGGDSLEQGRHHFLGDVGSQHGELREFAQLVRE